MSVPSTPLTGEPDPVIVPSTPLTGDPEPVSVPPGPVSVPPGPKYRRVGVAPVNGYVEVSSNCPLPRS